MSHSIALAAHSGTLVLNHAARQRSAPSRALPSSSTQLRGAGQQRLLRQTAPARQGTRQGAPVRRGLVLALFEKFTERSIKGVMLAQEEARRLQSAEVGRAPAAASHPLAAGGGWSTSMFAILNWCSPSRAGHNGAHLPRADRGGLREARLPGLWSHGAPAAGSWPGQP